MPITELDDDYDEDWDDHDSEDADDDESVPCPECGSMVHGISDKCPSCGYWLLDAERRATRSGGSKPLWLRATAAMLIIALLSGVLIGIAVRVFQ